MLLQFRFKNYKSFYDEAILDLTPSKEISHENHILFNKSSKSLSTIAIHGNNASGKTNILNALMLMRYFVIYSAVLDKGEGLSVPVFKFMDECFTKESEFEVFVTDDTYEYQYGFKIFDKKISEEWLYRKKISINKTINKVIFERSNSKIEVGQEYNKIKSLYESIDNDNILFMTILGKREIESISYIYNFFNQLQFTSDKRVGRVGYDNRAQKLLFENQDIRTQVNDFLKYIDPCLQGIEIVKDSEFFSDRYKLYGIHNSLDSKTINLDMEDESLGTVKFINLVPHIFNALINGCLVIVDELDTKLHPLVYRKVVSLFYDKKINKKNAQLIFTTHSTFLLNADDMRRDQLVMVEKDIIGKSNLYGLSDFDKLRIDSNYEKKYLSGEFGAIPFIDKD